MLALLRLGVAHILGSQVGGDSKSAQPQAAGEWFLRPFPS